MTMRIVRIVILSIVFIALAVLLVFGQQPPKAHIDLRWRAPENCRVWQTGDDRHPSAAVTPWESCHKARRQIKRSLKRGIYVWLERRDPHKKQ
jgi:hypothetical protein